MSIETRTDDRERRTLVAASAQRARDRRLATRDLVLSDRKSVG